MKDTRAALVSPISLLTGCLIAVASNCNAATPTAPTTRPNPVSVSLQQAVDKNCDGNTQNRQLAIPGACIVYTITATNLGNMPVFNVRLNGKIPKYTKLYRFHRDLNINSDKLLAEPILTSNPETGEPMIQSLYSRLDPGNEHSILMQYTVRIL